MWTAGISSLSLWNCPLGYTFILLLLTQFNLLHLPPVIQSPQQLQRKRLAQKRMSALRGLYGSSGPKGKKGVRDVGYVVHSEQTPNWVAVLQAHTSWSRVKNIMSPIIVRSNMMCKDGTVKLWKLNSYLHLTYRVYGYFLDSFEVSGLKTDFFLLSHPCSATKLLDLKTDLSALPTAMTLVSNGLKHLIFNEKSFYFTYILPLLVSAVSYIHHAVDELFSAMYYNVFQVTNINQLFNFFKKSHSCNRIYCILKWGLALYEKTSVQHSFIAWKQEILTEGWLTEIFMLRLSQGKYTTTAVWHSSV